MSYTVRMYRISTLLLVFSLLLPSVALSQSVPDLSAVPGATQPSATSPPPGVDTGNPANGCPSVDDPGYAACIAQNKAATQTQLQNQVQEKVTQGQKIQNTEVQTGGTLIYALVIGLIVVLGIGGYYVRRQ